jgi:DinB family protein
MSISHRTKDSRKPLCENRARHDFTATRFLCLQCEVALDVGEKSDHWKIRLHGTKSFDGLKGLAARVQIHDDHARRRLQQIQKSILRRSHLELDAEMLRGFRHLHLEEEIVHQCYDSSHGHPWSEGIHLGDKQKQKHEGADEGCNSPQPDKDEFALIVAVQRHCEAQDHVQSTKELCQQANHLAYATPCLEHKPLQARIARPLGRCLVQPALAPEMQHAVTLLEKTPVMLETLLLSASPNVLDWKPSPERWSIREVLGHVVDIEKLFVERVRRVLREDVPELAKFTPNGPLLGGPSADAIERMARFGTLRSELVGLLKGAPATAALRIGMHEELGPVTLAQLVNELANHDLGHLRQIAELYRARAFYPNAGPFQKYSNPQP